MKLSEKEQAICDRYSARDADGYVRCNACPLVIDRAACLCVANADGRTREAREMRRKYA